MIYARPTKLASVVAMNNSFELKSGNARIGAVVNFLLRMLIASIASVPRLIGTVFLSSECPLVRSERGAIILAKLLMYFE